ncbi:hypothetical protein A3715_03805 [Oleiphilus sp. HI0009]|uniref:uroporphyrinogen-III C-methyltransferase n=1 Tax=unclassified Oleiphilus TaxID=2631174 RepID=UPI0007C30FFD|nr:MULTISPECIES: uroporphyrinogen-III C-methyltransferase [unclassified Oleiphilus]KZX85457.1 hypothetical protein A3715_03805 [Oleiphilus sp. HI0009]KZY64111.1 hypothetical protein A3738_11130 [Oleiphilus sp. HI0066]KZY69898.1 hypothetical protein A3739_07625 [Oleiphilus sp. HI0067]
MSDEKPVNEPVETSKTVPETGNQPSQKTTASTKPKSTDKKSSGLLSKLLIIVVLVCLGTGGYFGFIYGKQIIDTQTKMSQQLGSLSKAVKDNQQALDALSNDQSNFAQSVESQQKQQAKIESEHQKSLSSLHQQVIEITGNSRQDWLLAEAEYLLRIANQRLLIEKDPVTAESLLGSADQVLSEADDAALMPIRVKIAEELLALRSMAISANDELIVRLSGLANVVESLTLETELSEKSIEVSALSSTSTPAEQSLELTWYEMLWSKIKTAFNKAVSIQRLEEKNDAPPSPHYAEYLKQNLALRIEQAKLLLMRQRQDQFKASISNTLEWMATYMPTNNASVDAITAELNEINQFDLSQTQVNIDGSLSMLQQLVEKKYRNHSLEKFNTPHPVQTEGNEQ